ncbi:MAG: EboA family metabolite traffic protein [Cyanobacteria bacterium J06626_4]
MVASTQHLLTESDTSYSVQQIIQALQTWLSQCLSASALDWLNQSCQQLSEAASERFLFTRFSAASRRVGKVDLALTEPQLQMAQTLRAGWMPGDWSTDQAVRTLLLLNFPDEDSDRYVAAIEKLLSAADVAEQVALYQSLPLLAYPERLRPHAIDGLRTNVTAAFNAIALNNPYPADYFDEAAWNQMVLKALFVDSRLSQIQGLEARANAKLAQMLSDYAHERWAAGRPVNPQLWRPLGWFATGSLVADLERALSSDVPHEQQAAALACASAPSAAAHALLERVPTLQQKVANGQLTWERLSITHP